VINQFNPSETGPFRRIARILSDSFAGDPVISHLFEGIVDAAPRRLAFFEFQVEDAFDRHLLDTEDGVAAIWQDLARPSPRCRIPFDAVAVFGDNTERAGITRSVMDDHHPAEPHWYLYFVGVDPSLAGRGLGTALVEQRLRQADDIGRSCYLEATTERSATLYERLGFVRRPPFLIPDGPVLHPMWRPARSSAPAGASS
jgi:ribosomal protein S18 acetylase RimI-like enzyme